MVLTGFGIGDSHLMPHQLTRAPGGWILVAQGAFNNSLVRTKSGNAVEFNRTLLGRFTPDGTKFETIGWGPCNIWGLVMNGEGEVHIVDWYNKVISHNEVPRNHPERDRARGRIWRVRHKEQPRCPRLDFTKLSAADLVGHVGSDSLAQSHVAWQQIIDRNAVELVDALASVVRDPANKPARRIQALWAPEGLRRATPGPLRPLLRADNRNLRREAVWVFGALGGSATEFLNAIEPLTEDPDPEVRAEIIRSAGSLAGTEPRAFALLARMARESLPGPVARGTHNGRPIKVREAYDSCDQVYLLRPISSIHHPVTQKWDM